jgi:hypothetical protein
MKKEVKRGSNKHIVYSRTYPKVSENAKLDKQQKSAWCKKKYAVEELAKSNKTFIKQHGIEKIDYLHVDAQGMDLRVLKSLGSYLSIVKEEMPDQFKLVIQ